MKTLGFDTSNYTTSAALYDGKSFISSRKILPVKDGERGLRQSDALFQHIKQLPEIIDGLGEIGKIGAVGVSTRPRSVEGSYMPVFLAGISFAKTAASVLGVPLFEFSHQDGHIMAGIYSSGALELLDKPFLSVHLSGGTTEILKTRFTGRGFDCKIVGATKDISAGQVIDRTGVRLGFKFPCGKALDKLSENTDKGEKYPISVKNGFFNFSGLEAKANQSVQSGEKIARGVFDAIGETLVRAVDYCMESEGTDSVLFVGGVASNMIIRERINSAFGMGAYFASAELSTDNACGIAMLAHCRQHDKNED